MNEKDFIAAHEHELMGWIIDAHVLSLEGAFRSKRLQELLQKVRGRLALMYSQLKAPVNGQMRDGPLKMVNHENRG